jgi:hypothetical protein
MKNLAKIFGFIVFAFVCIFLTGCASIISGRHQEVTFRSSPDEALVTIDGRAIGKTPLTAQIERKNNPQVVTIEKQGYKTETFQLKSTVNGWLFGNLVLGGLLGSTTDSVTGAAWAYSQDMFSITLNPIGATTPSIKSEVRTFVIANYKSLVEELNTKPDQYLKALFALMKVQPEKQDDFTKKVKQLADENKDIVDFADKVAALTP